MPSPPPLKPTFGISLAYSSILDLLPSLSSLNPEIYPGTASNSMLLATMAWSLLAGLLDGMLLTMEPRRLWRRYLVYGSEFAALVILELLGLKKVR